MLKALAVIVLSVLPAAAGPLVEPGSFRISGAGTDVLGYAIAPLAAAPIAAPAPVALESLQALAGAAAVAASAQVAAPESAPAATPAPVAAPAPRFVYPVEGVKRVSGVIDESGRPLDRYFYVAMSKVRDGGSVSFIASAFNQEFDDIAKQTCAAAGGTPVANQPRNARQTPDMESDTFFNPLVWGWHISLERYFRCEDAAGNLIPAPR